jgi:ABC-type transport system involved in cytochrome c biogenesis permease subunit
MGGDESAVATRASVVGVIAAINIPIINRSVEWWADRTLHQQSSITDGKLEDWTLFTMFLGIVVWGVFYTWAMTHRFRIAWLERELRDGDLDEAIAARRAEAATSGGAS